MNDGKIRKECLELIDRLDRLNDTSKYIRSRAVNLLKEMGEEEIDYGKLPIPGVSDLISVASSAKDVGTRLDLLIMLAAEENKQLGE